MAAPAVSGVAALLYSAAPEWAAHPDSAAELLRKTAAPHRVSRLRLSLVGAWWTIPTALYGFGEIDAYVAVKVGTRTLP